MTERNIIKSLTQKDVRPEFHPNLADPLATAPSITSTHLMSNLSSLGMSDAAELPKEFDWREQPGVQLTPPMNQGHCGNCWAVSSTQSFADRWMIATGKINLVLDPLSTTVCSSTPPAKGCGGGLPENRQEFFESVGASHFDTTCMSWKDYCGQTKCCDGCTKTNIKEMPNLSCDELKCSGGFKAKKGMMKAGTVTNNGNVDSVKTIHSIKTDIRLHGPIVAKFQVFGDFMVADAGLVVSGGKTFQWKSTNGVYINNHYNNELAQSFQKIAENYPNGDRSKLKTLSKGLMPTTNKDGKVIGEQPGKKSMGFHAVEIIGWGVDEKWGEYWIVKNSWGEKWNGDGYFKFGINNNGTTNASCGMDIPLIMKNGSLFGGTVSFIPTADLSITWDGEKDGDLGKRKKWWIWILIVLGAIAFIYFLYILFGKQQGVYRQHVRQIPIRQHVRHIPIRQTPVPSLTLFGNFK